MRRAWPCRWLWLALALLQPLWFLWWNPPELVPPLFVTALWLLPLAAAGWWVWRLHPRGLVAGGLVLLLHFSLGVSEAWVSAESRLPALVQIGLVTGYFAVLGAAVRNRKPAA